MKNDVLALAGSSPRAIETIPFTCFVSLNSGCRSCTNCAAFPSAVHGSWSAPVWMAKPRTTRWKRACRCRPIRGEPEEIPDVPAPFPEPLDVIGPAVVSSTARYEASSAGDSPEYGTGSGGGVSRMVIDSITMRPAGAPSGPAGGLRDLLHTPSPPTRVRTRCISVQGRLVRPHTKKLRAGTVRASRLEHRRHPPPRLLLRLGSARNSPRPPVP